ncbi:MAG: response regulator [Desulfobacteraceae bacterium]|nr:response regulator [Desulfobacteraceae bacterium]
MQYLSAILPLFSAIIYLFLGGFVFFLSRGKLRKVFLRFCCITFHWQFSWFLLFLLNDPGYSDLICRIGYSGIIFLPVSCYETLVHYQNHSTRHIKWFYGICFGFLVSLWTTDLFIKGTHTYQFGFYPEANTLHLGYILMVFFLFVKNAVVMIKEIKNERKPIRRNQHVFFLASTVIFCFSSIDYLLNYPALMERFNIQLYPFGVFFLSLSLLVFVLSHFITLNMTLENRVAQKTRQLKESIEALKIAANTEKEFIANVTHELRTPLTLIRGWTDYIIDGESGPVSAPLLNIIDKINLQTLSLTEKINELLKVSRFDAGMARLTLTRLDLADYVSQIVSSFKGLTDKNGINLIYQCEPDIPAMLMDREKLKDIINNLVRNAYKFTETGEIIVTVSTRDNTVIIEVKDTGIGMSEEFVKHAFQRFKQGDGSTTRRYEGTGLGLAIVKDSVDMMHGRITLDSTENLGTRFVIELPANLETIDPEAIIERRKGDRRLNPRKMPHGERRTRDRRTSDLAKLENRELIRISAADKTDLTLNPVKKIEAPHPKGSLVIAEDNQSIQEFLARTLNDYTLYITPNGASAWETIQAVEPDLVLSDVMMPFMDGYSLLEEIRLNENTKNIPVIMLTSLTEQDDRIKGLQLGADDYLTKPFHHLELRARVKNVISQLRLYKEKTRTEQLEVFLMVLASAIESKDKYTGGHVERVAGYARELAGKNNLPEHKINDIYLGTIVHDIGKLGIKDEILNKPGKLTKEEFEQIKRHPEIGKNLLSKLEIAPVAVNIAYNHHEKWDGTGYPRGIKGEDIPIEARIATVADFWDAITSDRPYRKAMPLDKAVEIMYQERGKSFDPKLFDLFMDGEDKLHMKYIDTPRVNEEETLTVET